MDSSNDSRRVKSRRKSSTPKKQPGKAAPKPPRAVAQQPPKRKKKAAKAQPGKGKSASPQAAPVQKSRKPSQSSQRFFDVNMAPIEKLPGVRSDGAQRILLPTAPPPRPKAEQKKGARKPKRLRAKGSAPPPTPAEEEARERRTLSRGEQRRRRNRHRVLVALLLFLIVGLGFFLSVNVLFKVEGYALENHQRGDTVDLGIYSEEAIIAALNVPVGENLFGFRAGEKAELMEQVLPYLEHITLHRRLPNTIVVRVTPAVPQYCIQGEYGWAELSTGLKTLSIQSEKPDGLMQIKIPLAQLPVVGFGVLFAGQDTTSEDANALRDDFDMLVTLLQKENILDGVKTLDLNDTQEITLNYQDRITVLLGTGNNLSYKLQLAGYILRNEDGNCLSSNDRGTLDVSHQRSDGSIQPVFSPENTVDITTAVQDAPQAESTPAPDAGEAQP